MQKRMKPTLIRKSTVVIVVLQNMLLSSLLFYVYLTSWERNRIETFREEIINLQDVFYANFKRKLNLRIQLGLGWQ